MLCKKHWNCRLKPTLFPSIFADNCLGLAQYSHQHGNSVQAATCGCHSLSWDNGDSKPLPGPETSFAHWNRRELRTRNRVKSCKFCDLYCSHKNSIGTADVIQTSNCYKLLGRFSFLQESDTYDNVIYSFNYRNQSNKNLWLAGL